MLINKKKTNPEYTYANSRSMIKIESDFILYFLQLVQSGHFQHLLTIIHFLHPADYAYLLGMFSKDEREQLFVAIPNIPSSETLLELDNSLREEILRLFMAESLRSYFLALTDNVTANILEGLSSQLQRYILSTLGASRRSRIRVQMSYDPFSALRIMHTDFLYANQNWTVADICTKLRETDHLSDNLSHFYVINTRTKKLLGMVSFMDLLKAESNAKMHEIMYTQVLTVNSTADQEIIARLFQRYNLSSAPVINDKQEVLGVIIIEDILDVVDEESEEDLLALGGIQDDDMHANVWQISRTRFRWLIINMITGLMGVLIIGFFRNSIAEIISLAILLPLIASMSGVTATQSMTITVRRLTTRQLTQFNFKYNFFKEVLSSAINALFMASLVSLIIILWFDNVLLGVTVGLSMLLNLVIACAIGMLIPIIIKRTNIDPAVVSPIFVTTITDMLSFLTFLSLATWIIL